VDKPSLAIALLGKKMKSEDTEDDDDKESELSDGHVLSAKAAMKALKADDAEGFAQALKDFYDQC
jgi:hypothetical protein